MLLLYVRPPQGQRCLVVSQHAKQAERLVFWRQHSEEDSCCAESLFRSSTVLLVAGRQVLVVAVNPTRTYILLRGAATSSTVCSTDSGRCCNASLSAMFPTLHVDCCSQICPISCLSLNSF